MREIARFIVPAVKEGSTALSHLFPGLRVRVDPVFQKLLDGWGLFFSSTDFECVMYEVPDYITDDWDIGGELNIPPFFERNMSEACALLRFLVTSPLFSIPRGREGVNIILGYGGVGVGGMRHVFYVEHEHKAGKEEAVHLHAKEMWPDEENWGDEKDRPLYVLRF